MALGTAFSSAFSMSFKSCGRVLFSLINNEGEVVGINSFTKKGTEGLNFAVSVDALHRLLSQKKNILFPTRPGN